MGIGTRRGAMMVRHSSAMMSHTRAGDLNACHESSRKLSGVC